jgi:hypothetical protein
MAQEPNEVDRGPLSDTGSTATAPYSSATTTDIRKQIEHTRAEMSETIDAIQERLSPARLVNDAKESVKDATVGRVKRLTEATNRALANGSGASTVRRVADAMKANPLPFAIAGVAIALACLGARRAFRPTRTRQGRSARYRYSASC